MTQFANLVLKNGDNEDVTFRVEGINYSSNVASWISVMSSYDVSPRITFSLTPPTARQTRSRVRVKVAVPLKTMLDPMKKADEILFNIEAVLPRSSDPASRAHALAYLKGMSITSLLENAVMNNEGVY